MTGNKHGSTYIEIKTLSKWLAYLVFALPFSFAFLMELLNLPGVIKFLVDFAWICIAALPVLRGKLCVSRKMVPFAVLVTVFAVDTVLVYLFRFQSPFYYIWGVRNNFRFYIAFFSFAAYFDEEDGLRCLNIMDKLFWINFAAAVVQFLMGNHQDCIGGIFGTAKGCNGYLIVYFSVVICKTVLSYMEGTETTVSCFSKCAAALFVSAIAELKFFFVVFIIILGMATVITSFSVKKVALLLIGTIFVSATAAFLGMVYEYFEGFLSLEELLASVTNFNYASDGDMGRFSAISVISKRFLKDFPSRMFGMGLGNCDVSSISLFNTQFYNSHVDMHYSLFSYSFMFLENGYVGLFLYGLFFVMSFFFARKRLKTHTSNPLFCQMSIILSAMCIPLIFYNSSLRTEAGYMVYFVMALPFIDSSYGDEANEQRLSPLN